MGSHLGSVSANLIKAPGRSLWQSNAARNISGLSLNYVLQWPRRGLWIGAR